MNSIFLLPIFLLLTGCASMESSNECTQFYNKMDAAGFHDIGLRNSWSSKFKNSSYGGTLANPGRATEKISYEIQGAMESGFANFLGAATLINKNVLTYEDFTKLKSYAQSVCGKGQAFENLSPAKREDIERIFKNRMAYLDIQNKLPEQIKRAIDAFLKGDEIKLNSSYTREITVSYPDISAFTNSLIEKTEPAFLDTVRHDSVAERRTILTKFILREYVRLAWITGHSPELQKFLSEYAIRPWPYSIDQSLKEKRNKLLREYDIDLQEEAKVTDRAFHLIQIPDAVFDEHSDYLYATEDEAHNDKLVRSLATRSDLRWAQLALILTANATFEVTRLDESNVRIKIAVNVPAALSKFEKIKINKIKTN